MENKSLHLPIEEVDPDVYHLIQLEKTRQEEKIILIPSESKAPVAVLRAIGSEFQNIYAEGYPDEFYRNMSEADIVDVQSRLDYFRRYSDPRYYKGVEYADLIEALARRRTAEVFSTESIIADDIYVNVQALSGAPANNAVYHALLQPGDTIMGMSLIHGGHLTHGATVNRSGKIYHSTPYSIDSLTQKIDYEQVAQLAKENLPKIIVAGYSSYPWTIDWGEFRKIADSVGALLLADISHVAGLVVGGVYPSPVGIADVITFTTHKTLFGPRGACILTTDPKISRKIDRAVFPGEQGGPHMNSIAGIAVAMKIARTDEFRRLQRRIVDNCSVFTAQLEKNGFTIPFGGTNTHLMNLDCSTIKGNDDTGLSGDQAARILDIAGIVVNRNTIPGDRSAVDPSGIRMGTPWVTQIGFTHDTMIELANLISDILVNIEAYTIATNKGSVRRAKVPFEVLENAKIRVRDLLSKTAGQDGSNPAMPTVLSYLDDEFPGENTILSLYGENIGPFLNFVIRSDIVGMKTGETRFVDILMPEALVNCSLLKVGRDEYLISAPSVHTGKLKAWLNDFSDGYVLFDDDVTRKIPGVVSVRVEETATINSPSTKEHEEIISKPYFVGIDYNLYANVKEKPQFSYQGIKEDLTSLKRTPIFSLHKQLGARMVPFAGWEMPVSYSSILEEHNAVRNSVGIFDVTHMGVYQVEGEDARFFLDGVCGNDILSLQVGESCYTHFLNPEGEVLDDLLVYRRGIQKFLLVVNSVNDEKDWRWLNEVLNGNIRISRRKPDSVLPGRDVELRNLRDEKEGKDMRVDIALQGSVSTDLLMDLPLSVDDKDKIKSLRRTHLCEVSFLDSSLVVSRTGYTGERIGYELFIHPDLASYLFEELLKLGEGRGILPVGLGARDSLRIEAGLPLYGHEMGEGSGLGRYSDLSVGEAGFSGYVKVYKPWFIGRSAFIAQEKTRNVEIFRFRFNEKGVRLAHQGDPVLDKRGKVMGFVTSCGADGDGFIGGQAILNRKSVIIGSVVSIYQGSPVNFKKMPSELEFNDRFDLPSQATILSRFLK